MQGGVLFAFRGESAPEEAGARESFIHIHVERVEDRGALRRYRGGARQRAGRRARVRGRTGGRWLPASPRSLADLKFSPPPLPDDEVAEAVQFLEWLAADNFTFLGFRSYVFPDRERKLEPQYETGLGILR